jgi:hypothetical protein
MQDRNEKWKKDELPVIEISKEDMKKTFFPMLYSAFYRIYVAAYVSFFTMVLAYLAYLYFLVSFRAKPINLLFLGFDIIRYVFLLVSVLLLILSGYFVLRHKLFSEFLLRFEKKVKLEGCDLSLRDLYLNDLYPKTSILTRSIAWLVEGGRLARGERMRTNYTVADVIGIFLVIILFSISILVIFQA